MDDWELLQAYAHSGSESAFQQLVERHVGLVHSMAMREMGDAHRAQDVTQAVFLILVRKAGSLSRKTVLPGWLFKATRHVARTALRGEQRRKEREMQALACSVTEPDPEAMSKVEAHLDDALDSLGESDRNALMLRYFQQRSLPDVAARLGTSEEAAQKRIERAVEKLRRFFGRRKVAVPAVALIGVFSAQAVQPAPLLLVQGISSLGVSSAPAASVAAVRLMQGALRTMYLSKLVTPGLVGAVALLLIAPVAGFFASNAPKERVYELSLNFSPASNPNGVWSYGWQSTLTGAFNVLSVRGRVPAENAVPIDYWQAVPMNEPTVYHNGTTNTAITDQGHGVFPPGTVWFSSGPNGSDRNLGVIRFTAPSTANYQVDTTVDPYLDASRQGDADFHVMRNGVELFVRELPAGGSAAHNDVIALRAGETVDFIIGRGADNNNYASALKITIRIAVRTTPGSSPRAGVPGRRAVQQRAHSRSRRIPDRSGALEFCKARFLQLTDPSDALG